MNGMLLLLLAQVAAPDAAPIVAAPVGDPILAEQRGGFRLPNGIDVSLAVQTQTAVNGAILLRTVFEVDKGAPTFTIYAPGKGEVVTADASGGERQSSQTTGPTISYDRSTGLQITPGTTRSTMSVSAAGSAAQPLPVGLNQVASGTTTDTGTITEVAGNGVRTVSLAGADLTITHLAGNAFGSAIANSGSDRAIDTQTTVSITLGNAGPDVLGSAMFRVQDMTLDSVAIRTN